MRTTLKITILLCACVLIGCRTVRVSSSTDSSHTSERVSDAAHYERLISSLRDSLLRVKAPQERSTSRGLQQSHLETTLAFSTAQIDSSGALLHSIENKDSIPSRIIYRDIYHSVRDTAYVYARDTIRYREQVYMERELSGLQKAQIRGFWVLICIIALALGIMFIRAKIKGIRP